MPAHGSLNLEGERRWGRNGPGDILIHALPTWVELRERPAESHYMHLSVVSSICFWFRLVRFFCFVWYGNGFGFVSFVSLVSVSFWAKQNRRRVFWGKHLRPRVPV